MFINSLSRKTDVSSYRIMTILAIPHMCRPRAGEKANANVKCPGGPTRPSVMLLDSMILFLITNTYEAPAILLHV